MFPVTISNVAAGAATATKEIDLSNRKIVAVSVVCSGSSDEVYVRDRSREDDSDDVWNRQLMFDYYYLRYVAFPAPWTPKKKVSVSFKSGGATTQVITFWCL